MQATKGRRGRGKFAAAVGLILALTAGFFAFAPSALAHHPIVSGVSTCEEDGTYTVEWTVGNSETPSDHWMLVREFSLDPNLGTTTGLVADASYDGLVNPVSYTGPGTLVAPSGEVHATTTGIPASATSIELSVTGRWRYGTGSSVIQSASFTVELEGHCKPQKGSLSIEKEVKGNSAPPGATYTISYDNGAGTSGQVTVQGGQTQTVGDLPFGTYTLSELNPPAGATVQISPNPAVVGKDSPQVKVTVTNTFPDLGSFQVNKEVTGATEGYVLGSSFTVSYSCTNGASGSLTLQDGQTDSVANLPVGTQCTLSEISKPATSGPSYVWGTESWSPSNVVTVAAATVAKATLTNPLEQIRGGFSVTKQVTGVTAGYVPGSTFTVAYDCDNGTSGSFTVADGTTGQVSGLPTGTECTLSEVSKPATSGPSYAYGPEVFSPSNVVTIGEDTVTQVTLTNPIERLLGAIEVTKSISGATAGYVAGSAFGFELDCPSIGLDQSFTLEAGDSRSFDDLPLGTTCTVDEVTIPNPVPGYEYGTPTVVPADGTVTVDSTTTPVQVAFDNPLVWLPNPAASIVQDCESGGAVVTLENNGGGEVTFRILEDGQQVGDSHTVGSEGSTEVLVPLAEDEQATITVVVGEDQILAQETVTQNCQEPSATAAVDCAEGGVVVTLTNDGESPVELTVSKGGEVVDTVVVGREPVEVVVPMDEDETATITVSDASGVVDEFDFTYDCQPPPTEPPSSSTTFAVGGITERPGSLPTTGSSVGGFVSLAAGLLLAGASLVGLSRRRATR
jgi:LPXTG-motif cell wall-anchored protein